MVEQYKSALNDAKTYVRRTIVVTLGDQARARDDKQQEKEEQEKSVMVGHSSFEVSLIQSASISSVASYSSFQATRRWA